MSNLPNNLRPRIISAIELVAMAKDPQPGRNEIYSVDTSQDLKSHLILWDGFGEVPKRTLCGRRSEAWRDVEIGYSKSITCLQCAKAAIKIGATDYDIEEFGY